MKKVSIITVCFNSEKTIEQTIRSVIGQSYGINNIEYIIIDGKSTDRTVEIVSKYRDKVSYFVSEPDKGIYDAMNKGIAVATGEIIGILNSDDWYEPDAIDNIVNCFEGSDADIVHGKVRCVAEDGILSEEKKPEALSQVWFFMPLWHPATFVKKEVYEKLGMFEVDYKIAADYEFILRCYVNDIKFVYLNKQLTNFRSTGISATKHIQSAEEANKVTMKYIEKAPDRPKVLCENDYRLKAAIFREKCESNPEMLISVLTQIRKKKVVVWGTGIWGRTVVKALLKAGICVGYLVDSEKERQGKKMLGVEIKSPDVLVTDDVFLLIAIRKMNVDIKNQLIEWGVERDKYLFLEEWIEMMER